MRARGVALPHPATPHLEQVWQRVSQSADRHDRDALEGPGTDSPRWKLELEAPRLPLLNGLAAGSPA